MHSDSSEKVEGRPEATETLILLLTSDCQGARLYSRCCQQGRPLPLKGLQHSGESTKQLKRDLLLAIESLGEGAAHLL